MAVDLTKMNYILLNSDGSVLTQSIEYYTQQGSTGTDKIFFASKSFQNTDVGQAICTLPNGQQNTLIGEWNTAEYQGETYGGFVFTLTTAQTNYNGGLMMALAVYRSNVRLVNYPLYLVINETGLQSDTDTGVTVEEINTYLRQVQNMLRIDNGIVVVANIAAISDWSAYSEGQLFFCKHTNTYYQKTETSPYYKLAEDIGLLGSKMALNRHYFSDGETVSDLHNLFTNKLFVLRYNAYDYLFQIGSGNPYGLSALNLATREFYYNANAAANDLIYSVINNAYKIEYVPYTGAAKNVNIGNHGITASFFELFGLQAGISKSGESGVYIFNDDGDISFYSYGDINIDPDGVAKYKSSEIANKSYVASVVTTLKANSFIVVDTEAYPTLDDFLDNYPAEEGYIYLYPSEVAEEGFLEYIYEGSQWLQIGTTQLNLSNYYTIPQTDTLLAGKVDKSTDNGLHAYTQNGATQGTTEVAALATPLTIPLRDENGAIKVGFSSSDADATPKSYVDGLILAMNNAKVNKTTATEKVYGTDDVGNQTTYGIDSDLVGDGDVVRRNSGTGTVVVGNPTAVNHAASKKYVDDAIAACVPETRTIANITLESNISKDALGNAITDDDFNASSNNPVKNKVITEEVSKLEKMQMIYSPDNDANYFPSYYVDNATGELVSDSAVDASDWIDISQYDRIGIKLMFDYSRQSSRLFKLAVYDKNKNYVAGCDMTPDGLNQINNRIGWHNLVFNNVAGWKGISFNNDKRYGYLRICWYKGSPREIGVFSMSNRYDYALEKILRDGGKLLYTPADGNYYMNCYVELSNSIDIAYRNDKGVNASEFINIENSNSLKFIFNLDFTNDDGKFILGFYDSDFQKVGVLALKADGTIYSYAPSNSFEMLEHQYNPDNLDGFISTKFSINPTLKARYARICWYSNDDYHIYLLGYKNRAVGTKDLLFEANAQTPDAGGYYTPDGGVGDSESTSIRRSEEYIDVEGCSGVRFILNVSENYEGYNIIFYDSEYNAIGNASFPYDTTPNKYYDKQVHTNVAGILAGNPKVTWSSNGCWFNVFFSKDFTPKYMRVCWHVADLPICFYAIKDLPLPKGNLTKYYDKIMNCMGDSITYGYTPDSGAQMESPYPSLLQAELGLKSVRNYGISGSTLTNKVGSQYYPMCERITDMEKGADIVCVFGGTNDYGNYNDIQLGTIDSTDTTTIYGALNSIANTLITNYPSAFLFFITPFHRADQTAAKASGLTLELVAQAIRDIGEKYSIPVLDFYKDGGFHPENTAFKNAGYSGNDRLHPSQKFMEEKLVPMIAHFIERHLGNK